MTFHYLTARLTPSSTPRWHRVRQELGKENMFSSVQTSPNYLPHGAGIQACPGRFFAAHENRVLMARIIMGYDFKLAEPLQGGHPMSHPNGLLIRVDPGAKFLFKRREPV